MKIGVFQYIKLALYYKNWRFFLQLPASHRHPSRFYRCKKTAL
eukprot:COSAG06_NODE_58046_length_278_cov_0.636872_1_plen_42_part_10